MNKTELIDKVAAAAGLKKDDAKKAVDAAINAVKDALAADDKVALIGFGTFSVATRPAHEGLNPRNKEKIQIPEKKVVKFKAGSELNAGLK
jgi:DNA-binding protein HU-beta